MSGFEKIKPTPENLFPMRSDITIRRHKTLPYRQRGPARYIPKNYNVKIDSCKRNREIDKEMISVCVKIIRT